MNDGLTIGDFATLTHVSIKSLRRYHEAGLLEPASVDPFTGYRYYSPEQIPTAQVIRRFRDLGMPVREITAVVRTLDPQRRADLIADHLDRLERDLDRTRAAVASLRRLLGPQAPVGIDVTLRTDPAVTVAAVSDMVELDGVLDWYAAALVDLDRAIGRRVGGVGSIEKTLCGLYDNELFSTGRGRAVLYVRDDHPPTVGRVRPLEIPAADLAVTVHRGSHDDIDASYGALGRYVAEQAMSVAGPVRERYLVGPRETDDEDAWRTEIGWPVFRTAV